MTDDDELIVHYTGGKVQDKNITAVTFERGITSIDDEAFSSCTSLKTIIIPSGVTNIASRAFSRCTSLQKVDLPSSITNIDASAFYLCTSLRSCDIPKGAKLGSKVFEGSWLQNVVIPDGIEIIPSRAFSRCAFLRTVELPATVKEIGSEAFNGSHSLDNVVIPNGLPALKKLDLEGYEIPRHWWRWINHVLINSPILEELSLREVKLNSESDPTYFEELKDDDIPMVLQLASLSPYTSLRSLAISSPLFTLKVFERLASKHFPQHLRTLSIRDVNLTDDDIRSVVQLASSAHCRNLKSLEVSSPQFTPRLFEILASQNIPQNLRSLSIRGINNPDKALLSASHFLHCFDAHPKLAIWTNKFWGSSGDEIMMVRHGFDMNHFGCRGFTVPDSLWPVLIQRLGEINSNNNKKQEEKGIETSVANILFHLIRRHSNFLVRTRKRKA